MQREVSLLLLYLVYVPLQYLLLGARRERARADVGQALGRGLGRALQRRDVGQRAARLLVQRVQSALVNSLSCP